VESEGYTVSKIPTWGFDYMIPNLKNPQVGPILSRLYARQVLAYLTDQNTMIAHFYDGYAIPTYGPVPVYPKGNPFVSPKELKNPYPYSISTAEKVLKANGWQVNPGHVDVCVKPGPQGCGAGVTKGEKFSLNLLISTGSTTLQEDTDLFQSDAAKAGIQINVKASTFNTVISQVQQCVLPKDKGTPLCNWQLGEYGGISQSTYPSGDGLLNTNGAFNAGQYSNSAMDNYISQSVVAPTLGAFYGYENLAVTQEPWIYQPDPTRVAATVNTLVGYGMTSEFGGYYGYIEPQYWYFTK
jgi:peptide/nickel transport system substrate-binding protein